MMNITSAFALPAADERSMRFARCALPFATQIAPMNAVSVLSIGPMSLRSVSAA